MYRYISAIEEALSFYCVGRTALDCIQNGDGVHAFAKTEAYTTLEAHKATDKVAHLQKMCENYLTQTYGAVQLVRELQFVIIRRIQR